MILRFLYRKPVNSYLSKESFSKHHRTEVVEDFSRSYSEFLWRLPSNPEEVIVIAGHWLLQPRSVSIRLDLGLLSICEVGSLGAVVNSEP